MKNQPDKTETKAEPKPQTKPVKEWTKDEINEKTDNFTEQDIKESLALRTPAMRALLRSKDGE